MSEDKEKWEITYYDNGLTPSKVYEGTKSECYEQFKKDKPQFKNQRVVLEKVGGK